MKNTRLQYACLLWLGLTACFDDNSHSADMAVSNIEITGLQDTSVISYAGNKLEVSPQVKTDYPEAQLNYAWYMYSSEDTHELGAGLENGYRQKKIAEGKNLSYEINLPSDTYTFVFEVASKTNAYTQTATMKVTVSTAYSKGFYILKETAGGATELDLYNQNGLRRDLMTALLGAPLPGRPLNLCVTQNQSYIDEQTQEMAADNMVHVFTDRKEFRSFRSEDMTEVFNRSNLLFDPMPADEAPCSMLRMPFVVGCLSNKGLYTTSPGDAGKGSGKFGFPLGNGASRFVQPAGDPTSNLVWWNNTTRHLDFCAGAVVPMEYADKMPQGMDESALECISSGVNFVGYDKTVYFLCQDRNSGLRYLYLMQSADQDEVTEIRRLDAGLHIAQGETVAGNALTATVIYAVHLGQLWAYDWNTGQEYPVPLPGLPAGETLAYVSNQYLNIVRWSNKSSDNFNRLIVGTQNGDQYKLYFYDELVGSSPVSEARQIVAGTGKVKSVRYATALLFDMNDLMSFDAPLFPYGD